MKLQLDLSTRGIGDPDRRLDGVPASAVLPALLLLAIAAVYAGTLSSPFLYDDAAFLQNPRTRQMWPPAVVLGDTARPLLRLSLAVNHAVSRRAVWSYHAVNIAIHLLATLALYGLVRRTLELPGIATRWRQQSRLLAAVVAGLWGLHPLQTQAVTYIVQRAESAMGLLYLVTLYCVVRGAAGGPPRRWYVAAIAACAAGMATKEVMVSAPLVVLLYDRTFLAGSFACALRRRWPLHLAMASTWLVVAGLWQFNLAPRPAPTAGFAYEGVSPGHYFLTQPQVILHYLGLVFWPKPLCLEYDWPVMDNPAQALPWMSAIAVLLGLAGWALGKRPAAGFLGVGFFLILLPTSSFMPISVLAADHRMYLPLAAVIALTVFAAGSLADPARGPAARRAAAALPGAAFVAATALGLVTVRRNADYASAGRIWQQAVDDYPESFTARMNLGSALVLAGHAADAEPHFREALTLRPNSDKAHCELGNALRLQGRIDESLPRVLKAVELAPGNAEARTALGRVYVDAGRLDEAAIEFRRAIEAAPNYLDSYALLAKVLLEGGATSEAGRICRRALAVDAESVGVRLTLGRVLLQQGRTDEGLDLLTAVLGEHPDAAGHNNLAIGLATAGRTDEAVMHFRAALALYREDPYQDSLATAHCIRNQATALLQLGAKAEAARLYRQAIAAYRERLDAGDAVVRGRELAAGLAEANVLLGGILLASERSAKAEPLLRQGMTLLQGLPGMDELRITAICNLGRCLADLNAYEDGERLLVLCAESRSARGGIADVLTREAYGALIRLYENWGRPQAAQRYRDKLRSHPAQEAP